MEDWNSWHEAIKASYSLIVSVVTLGLGWLVGQALTYRWNVRQKRREAQISATQQFYAAYGEFFAVWKLWNRLDRSSESRDERQWELHKRAAAAEAVVAGTLVKLASELTLDDQQVAILGRFRQAFQQLRQSIRGGRLFWTGLMRSTRNTEPLKIWLCELPHFWPPTGRINRRLVIKPPANSYGSRLILGKGLG